MLPHKAALLRVWAENEEVDFKMGLTMGLSTPDILFYSTNFSTLVDLTCLRITFTYIHKIKKIYVRELCQK